MSLSLDLNDLNIQEAVKAAVLGQITAEARERLVKDAIEFMLKPGQYRGAVSPLQEAINGAVSRLAFQIAEEEIGGREDVRAAVRQLLGAAVEKIMAGDYEVSMALGEVLRVAIRGE